MSKQNSDKRNTKRKVKTNPKDSYSWTEQSFSQLYPTPPILKPSANHFGVSINYHGIVIKIMLPAGIENKHLPYLFHLQIFRLLLTMLDPNPLLKTAHVVGFESIDSDLLLDYQISIGQGVLNRKTAFNCLEYVAQGRLKRYKICKCLAIGGFSKVYLVRSLRDGQFYAMKVMSKRFINQNNKESIIENEKKICTMLNHPFVVKLNHCFETHNFVCFVLDYCPGGQLFFYLKSVQRMSETHARFYFIEILYGLMYLHQQNIIYRDLKPENLLINYDGHIKIADFGLSKYGLQNREVTYSYCGSTEYMPPQMIQRVGHSYGVDFYTLGALLYELVTGLPPFYSRHEQQIKDAIVNEDLTFPDHVELSNEIKSLLMGLLQKNVKLRIGSLKGLKEVLFHPWIGRVNSEVVLSKKLVPPHIPANDVFNFDENELGDDEREFTATLMTQSTLAPAKERLIFRDFEYINESLLRSEVKQIYEKYKQVKKPLVSYSSSKSLGRKSSKGNLKKQSSSPYLLVDNKHKMLRDRSHTRKNRSMDMVKLKKNSVNVVGIRNKSGECFECLKTADGDLFLKMDGKRKGKQNGASLLLKKKRMEYESSKH